MNYTYLNVYKLHIQLHKLSNNSTDVTFGVSLAEK